MSLAIRLAARSMVLRLVLVAFLVAPAAASAQVTDATATLRDFHFADGSSLPELKLHYLALGKPRRDARGVVRNAVLILHGTGGTGSQFVGAGFAGELFAPGKLLDTTRFYVILPDNVGHGKSSKPSDGMHARFPHYGYDDMVRSQHEMLASIGVNHLRLVMGTSMGCMHAWVWGYTYPDFADGLVPLACAPTQIAGRNRMIRRMIMDDIRGDPMWKDGEYTSPPPRLRDALQLLYIMSSAPLVQHKQAPTRESADSVITTWLDQRAAATDANDMLYQFDASRDYDPSTHLEQITAPVLAINSADDFVNPPELGIVEKLMPRVKKGRFVMIPISDKTRGHGTHTMPAIWGSYLKEFMANLPQR